MAQSREPLKMWATKESDHSPFRNRLDKPSTFSVVDGTGFEPQLFDDKGLGKPVTFATPHYS